MNHGIINTMVVEKTKIAINIIIAIAANIMAMITITTIMVVINMIMVAMVVMVAIMEIVTVAVLVQIARTVVKMTKISTTISSQVVNREFLFVEFTIRLHASPESTKETLTVSLSSLFTYAQRHVSL